MEPEADVKGESRNNLLVAISVAEGGSAFITKMLSLDLAALEGHHLYLLTNQR